MVCLMFALKLRKMNLNLDNNFSPFTKGENIKIESFTFSGGEPHIKILSNLSNVKEVNVSHRIQSFQDFGLLLLTIDALKRMGIEKINVFIPYFFCVILVLFIY